MSTTKFHTHTKQQENITTVHVTKLMYIQLQWYNGWLFCLTDIFCLCIILADSAYTRGDVAEISEKIGVLDEKRIKWIDITLMNYHC